MENKIPSHYRDDDAHKHQEVHTPKELMDRILSFLDKEDFSGDLLDPCVGPGAMIKPIIEGDYSPKSITVCDIQKIHIDNFIEYCNKKGIKTENLKIEELLDLW